MKVLKIAMITGTFPTVSETFVVNQIMALKNLGHQVDVFCFNKTDLALDSYSHANITNVSILNWHYFMPIAFLKRCKRIITITLKALKCGLFTKLLSASIFKNGRILNTHLFFKTYFEHLFTIENYDVLHIHFGTNAVHLLTQIEHFKKKVVVTFHGFDVHKHDALFYEPLIKQRHILYTVNTNYTKNIVIHLGFPEDNISILPVGLDTNFFKPEKQTHDTFNVLFVGRLVEFKAPLFAIQIVHNLIKQGLSDIRLTLIGSGELYDFCKQYIDEHHLEKFISLVGNKTQNEIKHLMDCSDVFLFPGIVDAFGRCENQGLVIQEAQSMELPVIVSDVGGIKEGLLDRKSGYVIKAKDFRAFEEKITFLKTNSKEPYLMGETGRDFVRSNYDNMILAERLICIYSS